MERPTPVIVIKTPDGADAQRRRERYMEAMATPCEEYRAIYITRAECDPYMGEIKLGGPEKPRKRGRINKKQKVRGF